MKSALLSFLLLITPLALMPPAHANQSWNAAEVIELADTLDYESRRTLGLAKSEMRQWNQVQSDVITNLEFFRQTLNQYRGQLKQNSEGPEPTAKVFKQLYDYHKIFYRSLLRSERSAYPFSNYIMEAGYDIDSLIADLRFYY